MDADRFQPRFAVGQSVLVRTDGRWQPGKVMAQWYTLSRNGADSAPTPYLVQLDDVGPVAVEMDEDSHIKAVKDCAMCGAAAAMDRKHKSCARCKVTWYCSNKCQKKHWKGDHKQHCRPPPRLLTGAHAQAACAEQASQSPQQSGAQQAPKMGLMNPATGELLPLPDTFDDASPLTREDLEEFVRRSGCRSPTAMDAMRFGALSIKVAKAFDDNALRPDLRVPKDIFFDAATQCKPNSQNVEMAEARQLVDIVFEQLFPADGRGSKKKTKPRVFRCCYSCGKEKGAWFDAFPSLTHSRSLCLCLSPAVASRK